MANRKERTKTARTCVVQADGLLEDRSRDRSIVLEPVPYFPGGGPNGFCMPNGPDAALPPPPPDVLAAGILGFIVGLSGTAPGARWRRGRLRFVALIASENRCPNCDECDCQNDRPLQIILLLQAPRWERSKILTASLLMPTRQLVAPAAEAPALKNFAWPSTQVTLPPSV